jgi:hypothetical protein
VSQLILSSYDFNCTFVLLGLQSFAAIVVISAVHVSVADVRRQIVAGVECSCGGVPAAAS